MTSTLTIGPEQQRLEGRTVRDIVEHDPAQVNEVWCRKIFRHLLQSLELQYAMHMPRRAITADTVIFHDNGEPLLLPSELPGDEQDVTDDLRALAGVVHFAITREAEPTGPLRGRALEGYSESLINAVDRCMSPDPAERPHSIDELRQILGIVSLGAVAPAPSFDEPADGGASVTAAAPASATASVPASASPSASPSVSPTASAGAAAAPDSVPSFMREARGAGLSRRQRWALGAGGAAILAAVALVLFAELRDSGSYDHIVLTLPQSGERTHGTSVPVPPPAASEQTQAQAQTEAQTQAQDQANDMAQAQTQAPAAEAAPQAPADSAMRDAQPAPAESRSPASGTAAPPAAAAPPATAPASRRAAAPAATAGASYRLQIQPWGVVYVDGVDRGVSPPVKRLSLKPGKHTIRIANPNFHDRVLEVDTSGGGGQIAVNFRDEAR